MKSLAKKSRYQWLLYFIVLLWVVEIIDFAIFRGGLNHYGAQSRTFDNLQGYLFMPFLHGDFTHLFNNTIGLAVFGALLLIRGWRDLAYATAGAFIGSSLFIWLLAPSASVHIGASGIIFGWWSYLIARAFYEKNVKSILIATAVIFFFGTMIYGVLPGQAGISWQGHLGGAVGGVVGAWAMSEKRSTKTRRARV
ncbi:rhomboid family intramembrane serine protease [Rubellicoccus peritrichatus]|uniref:Rhomboid family intramembrane serine protease n=1 Tax=Rubellicoccus peritrichatus TaxID=3080537 RepID=A0AAQ3QQ37_9BACT|nr:rhomboid family intramembrane serine protease [Puniceicoccus sp. CR14]WOO39803.1 rhomboid family intramembrane serine protease [Puniceicoccus sp. CR14]